MFALQTAGSAAAPVAGHLSDRMGRKSVMMTSMAMTAVGARLHGARPANRLAFVFFRRRARVLLYAIRRSCRRGCSRAPPATWGERASECSSAAQALGLLHRAAPRRLVADSYGLTATFAFLAGRSFAANLFILFMPRPSRDGVSAAARCGEMALQHLEPHFRSLAGRDSSPPRPRYAARHPMDRDLGPAAACLGYLQYRLVGNYRLREWRWRARDFGSPQRLVSGDRIAGAATRCTSGT